MRQLLIAAAALAPALGGVAGCAETAAVSQAAGAAQVAAKTAADVAEAIPAAVRLMAEGFVANNNLNWGKPAAIYADRDQYIFYYPTPDSERRQGRLRLVIINRTDYVTRLARLQNGG